MKTTEQKSNNSVPMCADEITAKPALRRRAALLWLGLCAALFCSAFPAAAQYNDYASWWVTDDLVFVGCNIHVGYEASYWCQPWGVEATLNVVHPYYGWLGTKPITMNENPVNFQYFYGTYPTTEDDVGYDYIVVDDIPNGCEDIGVLDVTVCELGDIRKEHNPAHSDWNKIINNGGYDNYVALKSPVSTDVVTYVADVFPAPDEAGPKIRWSGAAATSAGFEATIPANVVSGPTAVYAYVNCDGTIQDKTHPITNWVFMANIDVHTSGWDSDDPLTFSDSKSLFPIADGQTAGSWIGISPSGGLVDTDHPDPSCQSDPGSYAFIATKAEIVATLLPAHVGDVLSKVVHFTFNNQLVWANAWWPPVNVNLGINQADCNPPVASGYGPDSGPSACPKPTFEDCFSQTNVLNHDKVFATDAPGLPVPVANFSVGETQYCGQVLAFKDRLFIGDIIGDIPVSGWKYWHSFMAGSFRYTPAPGVKAMTIISAVSFDKDNDAASSDINSPTYIPTKYFDSNDTTSKNQWRSPTVTTVAPTW